MTENPEQSDLQKEATLANAPFTKHFLKFAKENTVIDIDKWSAEHVQLFTPLEEKLKNEYGNNWQNTILYPLLITTDIQHVSNQNLELRQKGEFVRSMFLMGYEVGKDNLEHVKDDIIVALVNIGFLDNESFSQASNDTCVGVLRVGTHFKNQTNGVIPNVFEDFINNLK
jgi:hypothetical protein